LNLFFTKLFTSFGIDLADFIHECLYGFDDMKDRMENEVLMVSLKYIIFKKKYPFSSKAIMRLMIYSVKVNTVII
jgi:hypothetical protein